MTIDQFAQGLITSFPNFAIAVWVIWNYQQTIKNLLDSQQALINQLMALHPPQDPPIVIHTPAEGGSAKIYPST